MGIKPYQILYLNIYALFYVNYIAIKLFYKVNVKQPRCPSTDEWMKMWYVYTMEYYSATKKNNFESVLLRWMNLQPVIQNEVSQKEKNKYNILMHIYGI